MNDDLAIIIPAYNEETTIKEVIIGFNKLFPLSKIYVIDNNSTDKTRELAKEALVATKNKGDILFVPEQGKAKAMRYAFKHIQSEIYVMVDADNTYFPEDLTKMLALFKEVNADMIIGDRHSSGCYAAENKRSFHTTGNQLVKTLINTLFDANLNDIMSGYRVFSKSFVKNYPILCNGFELETDMTIHALHFSSRITEVPVKYVDRQIGSLSKLNTFTDGLRVLKTIFIIFKDYKPFIFFSTLSAALFISSLFAGIWPIVEFIENKFIHKVPLAILATGLMLSSFISFGVGLILNTVAKLHRFNFELKEQDFILHQSKHYQDDNVS